MYNKSVISWLAWYIYNVHSLLVIVKYTDVQVSTQYRIAGNFRGRKLLTDFEVFGLPARVGGAKQSTKVLFANFFLSTNSWKFSPSKVSRYTVFPIVCVTNSLTLFLHIYTEHQNFFGIDENVGPVAISLRRERIPDEISDFYDVNLTAPKYQHRVIMRTSQVICYTICWHVCWIHS